MSGIFRAYDIRGSYPEELDIKMAERIGHALVTYLDADRIVLGRDMRLSSQQLAEAFVKGAISAGARVSDVGTVTTPMLYYAIIEGGFDGGAMVTASHLPANMNGFKLCRQAAIPLSGDHGLPDIQRQVEDQAPASLTPAQGSYQQLDLFRTYVKRLGTFVHNPGSLKIVVDAGNGMAGPEVTAISAGIPSWQLVPMYMGPDGRFPHHVPNPLIPSTTKELQDAVIRRGADVGVAFDGDADRCGFIDEQGRRIAEDLVTALIAQFLLRKEPGATILYDLRSSRVVPETIRQLGGKAIRTRVGHAFIKAKMREEKAVFAGELSGHYYYRDMGFTDNAMLTMIHILNLLASSQVPLSSLVQPLMRYTSTGEINLKVTDKTAVLTTLEAAFADGKQDHLDGLTVEYHTWWFNVRPSNTEPVLRLNLEAQSRAEAEHAKEAVLKAITAADPSARVDAQ
jgi:phosphomannomutase